jgi:D-arabinose 1-dehydrogenase-like Zn-dependent alcohol dehydrogenase
MTPVTSFNGKHAAVFGLGGSGFIAAQALVAGGARVAVHRLRKRFREVFREEIANTVADSRDIDDEVRYLVGVLAE